MVYVKTVKSNMRNNYLVYILVGILLITGIFFLFKTRNTSVPYIDNSNHKLQVTTSFYPLYFFSSQIGGDMAEVKNITPTGVEPHDYEPTAQDIARIEKSDLLVLNGEVESWGNKIKNNLQGKDIKVLLAGEGLLTKQLDKDGTSIIDPHLWLDPVLAKQQVNNIANGFISIDSPNTAYYQHNQQLLGTQLDQLDHSYKTGLSNCQQRDIITSHTAFGYLAARYGLNQVAISGLSPDQEPSSQQLVTVAKYAKEHNVKYIFFESLVSPKLADTVAQEIGAQTLVLDPLEGISNDDIEQGKNYFTVMEENLKNLQTALQCKQ